MNPSSEEILFEAVAKMSSEVERSEFLDRACEGQPGLRKRLEALLAAHHETNGVLLPEDVETEDEFIQTGLSGQGEGVGTTIGRYKLLEKIGEGGFGVVHMAVQTEPVVRRVALKVIKLGMDTKEVIARFEAERQALAMMDDPNIAKVFDAGATESGRPYFVMELVKGIPITQFCNERQLDTRRRLDLFQDVCSAVQHAHQKGVIHRDLKPSNILVTLHGDKAVPKVIDFGIAKVTHQPLTDKTLFTRFGHLVGTPVYMSPEQATLSGLDIDTRADIYALGVLLYELLTGKPPFDAKSLLRAGYDEMRRIIHEEEPPKPSTRLSTMAADERATVAKQHHAEPDKLGKLVRGDLDWIVMKAIEKDRTRRYDTANAVAQDIRRHLRNEPVVAAAPSVSYKLQKFVRRNRGIVAVTVTIIGLLVTGISFSTWLAVRKSRAERQSAAQAEKSRQIGVALSDLLERIWFVSTEGAVLLEFVSSPTLAALEGQPEIELEISLLLGRQIHALALADSGAFEHKRLTQKSAEIFSRALELARTIYEPEDPELATIMVETGNALRHVDRLKDAEELLRGGLSILTKQPESNDGPLAYTQALLAITLERSGQNGAASEVFRSALSLERKFQKHQLAKEDTDSRLADLETAWTQNNYHAIEFLFADARDLTIREARRMLETRAPLRKSIEEAEENFAIIERNYRAGDASVGPSTVQMARISLLRAKAYETTDAKKLLALLEQQKSEALLMVEQVRRDFSEGTTEFPELRNATEMKTKIEYELLELRRFLRAGGTSPK